MMVDVILRVQSPVTITLMEHIEQTTAQNHENRVTHCYPNGACWVRSRQDPWVNAVTAI